MDREYMRMALELAVKGEGAVNPNPRVGAGVVKNGKVIGKGYHRYFGGPHAEVYAIEEAGLEANGAEIYVTLEPCSHFGKTPPCADKIIAAGIKKCYIAMKDPNPLVAGRGVKRMQEAGIEVVSGIMEEEAVKLNHVFLKYITKLIFFPAAVLRITNLRAPIETLSISLESNFGAFSFTSSESASNISVARGTPPSLEDIF